MDYVAIFLIVCACSFMYKVAEADKRRGWLWGLITLVWAMVLSQVLASGLLFFVATVICAYLSMFAANLLKDDKPNF